MAVVVYESDLVKENLKFFGNGEAWPGIQSFQFNYDQNYAFIPFLGQKDYRGIDVLTGPKVGSLSTNGVLNSSDIYIQYTGNLPCNALILNNLAEVGFNFSANNSYLTSYTNRYSVNDNPQINLSFQCYGDVGKVPVGDKTLLELIELTLAQTPSTLQLNQFHVGCANLSSQYAQNYRILSYEISIQTPRNPVYRLGATTPTVLQKYPIEIGIGFSVEIPNFNSFRLSDYPVTKRTEDLTITLSDINGNTLQSYSFDQMILKSQSISASTSNSLTINLSYNKVIL